MASFDHQQHVNVLVSLFAMGDLCSESTLPKFALAQAEVESVSLRSYVGLDYGYICKGSITLG